MGWPYLCAISRLEDLVDGDRLGDGLDDLVSGRSCGVGGATLGVGEHVNAGHAQDLLEVLVAVLVSPVVSAGLEHGLHEGALVEDAVDSEALTAGGNEVLEVDADSADVAVLVLEVVLHHQGEADGLGAVLVLKDLRCLSKSTDGFAEQERINVGHFSGSFRLARACPASFGVFCLPFWRHISFL